MWLMDIENIYTKEAGNFAIGNCHFLAEEGRSMSTKIKIDGLVRLEDIDYVNQAQPDFAGVVLSRHAMRAIDFDQAREMRRRLDPNIPLVGVFVNDLFMDVLLALRENIIDIAQLYGTESEEYITHLQVLSGKPVIKACQVHSPSVLYSAANSSADHILLGSGVNSGKCFDWSMLQNVTRPYFLSGGLDAQNLPDAINQLHPWGVNLSFGVETDGKKDHRKIMDAVAMAHSR
jgi:phosphoribosylanthranilate isomerase